MSADAATQQPELWKKAEDKFNRAALERVGLTLLVKCHHDHRGAIAPRKTRLARITSYNVCYTKLLRTR